MAGGVAAEEAAMVVNGLEEILRGRDAEITRLASEFGAHVLTTWRLSADAKAAGATEECLLGFAAAVLLGAQANDRRDLWLACNSGTIAAKVLAGRGKVWECTKDSDGRSAVRSASVCPVVCPARK